MGRPLKIQKYATMAGIMANGSQSASAVAIDQGYPPFAAPTSMQTDTVVLPSPATTIPFTGVVGGVQGGGVSATYPIIEVTANIQNSSSGSASSVILRQKGAHKFLVATAAGIDPADAVIGATPSVSLRILTLGDTNWQAMGAPAGAAVGTVFSPTAASVAATTGTAQEVGQCVLANDSTPAAGEMNISMAVGGDSTLVYISKLTNKFVQDFNGGEAGGNANTGNVWNPSQVANDIEYAANFFTDASTFAKSGAETDTWAGTQQNSNGTLGLAQVDKLTS
jgi:hypothetical protein